MRLAAVACVAFTDGRTGFDLHLWFKMCGSKCPRCLDLDLVELRLYAIYSRSTRDAAPTGRLLDRRYSPRRVIGAVQHVHERERKRVVDVVQPVVLVVIRRGIHPAPPQPDTRMVEHAARAHNDHIRGE